MAKPSTPLSVAARVPASPRAKPELRPRLVFLPRPEDDRRKARLVGCVWKVLRLQAEAAAVRVDDAALAANRAVEEIAGVQLYARLRRRDLHRATARWRGDERDAPRLAALTSEHEGMVVATRHLQLRMVSLDPRADPLR